MINFKLLGIPVRIEPWFWVTMIFIGGGADATNRQAWLFVGLFVFAGFISILVHELGHALTIRKYKLPTEITLVAFGGYASYPIGVLNRRQSFLVTAAGPAIQLVLGVIAVLILKYAPIPEHSLLKVMLFYLTWISIVWALFNCLPIFPLDGGQMLGSILGDRRRTIVHIVGIAVSVVVGILAYWQLGAWVLAAFMAYFAWINWQGYQALTVKNRD